MAAADRILKNFSLSLDGIGYVGKVDTAQIPALTLATEEFRAGGMDAPIKLDMGQEAMEAEFTLSSFDNDAIALWGRADTSNLALTLRGALEDADGTVTPLIVNISGPVQGLEAGEMQAGQKGELSFTQNVRTLRWTQDGEVLIDLDIPNMVRIVNGVDQLAEKRAALGI